MFEHRPRVGLDQIFSGRAEVPTSAGPEVGDSFCGRNHTTVLHAVRNIAAERGRIIGVQLTATPAAGTASRRTAHHAAATVRRRAVPVLGALLRWLQRKLAAPGPG
jgi:hypothetical protein